LLDAGLGKVWRWAVPVDTVEAAIAARFVPPVFSSLLGGAREEEEIADWTGGPHRRHAAYGGSSQRKQERKPRGLDDRTACLVRRFAPAVRRSFSRLGRCRVHQRTMTKHHLHFCHDL